MSIVRLHLVSSHFVLALPARKLAVTFYSHFLLFFLHDNSPKPGLDPVLTCTPNYPLAINSIPTEP